MELRGDVEHGFEARYPFSMQVRSLISFEGSKASSSTSPSASKSFTITTLRVVPWNVFSA